MKNQMMIPGLEAFVQPKPSMPANKNVRQELAELKARVTLLEAEVTKLQIYQSRDNYL